MIQQGAPGRAVKAVARVQPVSPTREFFVSTTLSRVATLWWVTG